MTADDLYYPFNGGNVADPRPLITQTYYNDNGVLTPNATGGIAKTAVGFGTNWPIALEPRNAFDFWANVKMCAYHVDVAFLSSTEFSSIADVGNYDDMQSIAASGVLRRCFISSGSMFKHALKSFRRAGPGNGRNIAEDIVIDFTQCFYDYRNGSGIARGLWWFPYIKFNIVAQNGYIMNGSDANYTVDFQGFPIPPLPIEVKQTTNGVPIMNPRVFRADIQVIERYDDIDFWPQKASPGTVMEFYIPAYQGYDGSAWRDGFIDVTEVTFGGDKTVTEITKIPNIGDIVDRIRVVVPAGAETDVVRFKSVANPAKPETTTDYYSTNRALVIA